MNHEPAFLRDPYCTHLETRVLHRGDDRGRPYVVLEDTVFYPEGGGQPSDQGWIEGIALVGLQKHPEGMRHLLSQPLGDAATVKLTLDWGRRFDHMQQHTGQHVLTAVAQDRHGWSTLAFHLGPEVCDIELDAPNLVPQDLRDLEEAVAQVIRAAHPVACRWVDAASLEHPAVRTRGLPEGHQGPVRLVDVAGVDLNTCGGTHVRNTSELECVSLLGTEPIRGGTRLFFAVGGRVRQRMAAHETRNHTLRTVLGAADETMLTVIQQREAQTRTVEQRLRATESLLAAWALDRLQQESGVLWELHLPAQEAGFLQPLAKQWIAADPGKLVFLTSTTAFVLAAGTEVAVDLARLGQEVATLLETKGGGAKGFFQGRVGSLARRAEVVQRLKAVTFA